MSTALLVTPDGTTAIARPRTHLNIVLDESVSMASVRLETIEAVNQLLDKHRHHPVDETFVTLTKFSDPGRFALLQRSTPIAQVRPLSETTYLPDGMTALLDGIYKTIVGMERTVEPGDRVLTVIITDGDENSSREIQSASHMRRIIQLYEARGNWTFVFLGANMNAHAVGAKYGVPHGNSQSYSTAAGGVSAALQTVSNSLKAYREGDRMQTGDFWTDGAPKTYPTPEWTTDDIADAGDEDL